MYYYTYHAFDEFRAEYKKNFGKEVYVGPHMQVRWYLLPNPRVQRVICC